MAIDFSAALYEVGEGFPVIESWHLDPHLELSFWDSSLHFQRGNKETRQLERLHVILFEGRLRSADVDLSPLYLPTQIAFPRVIGGEFAEETDRGGKKLMGGLLRFESGSLGFSFLRAFHIRQTMQLGPPPILDARFVDAMRKQEERTGQPQEGEPQPVVPLNYHGWTIFGLGLVGGDLLSFNLMAHGVAAEGRPHRAKLIFSRPTRAIFSRSNYLHQGRLSRIEEISHREIDGPRTAYHFSFTGGSFIEIEARGCAAIEWQAIAASNRRSPLVGQVDWRTA